MMEGGLKRVEKSLLNLCISKYSSTVELGHGIHGFCMLRSLKNLRL